MLDEADRLLEFGFEQDSTALLRLVRGAPAAGPPIPPALPHGHAPVHALAGVLPWCLLFSATLGRALELARATLAHRRSTSP